jgi:hypothetical protein
MTMDPPRSGKWIARVESTLAKDAPFELRAVAELTVPDDNVLRQTARLDRSLELNLMLEKGGSFAYSFEATAPVRWNVHAHPPEGVKYWLRGPTPKPRAFSQRPRAASTAFSSTTPVSFPSSSPTR